MNVILRFNGTKLLNYSFKIMFVYLDEPKHLIISNRGSIKCMFDTAQLRQWSNFFFLLQFHKAASPVNLKLFLRNIWQNTFSRKIVERELKQASIFSFTSFHTRNCVYEKKLKTTFRDNLFYRNPFDTSWKTKEALEITQASTVPT
jgi:hypothetical protein